MSEHWISLGRVALTWYKWCSRRVAGGNRTFARHRPDFHANAIRQTWAFSRNGNRFVHGGDIEKEIAANCFFRFGEWAVGNDTILSRNDFSLSFERVSSHRLAFFGKALEPIHPIVCNLLQFLRRETFA